MCEADFEVQTAIAKDAVASPYISVIGSDLDDERTGFRLKTVMCRDAPFGFCSLMARRRNAGNGSRAIHIDAVCVWKREERCGSGGPLIQVLA